MLLMILISKMLLRQFRLNTSILFLRKELMKQGKQLLFY